jgi:hypothetical protein
VLIEKTFADINDDGRLDAVIGTEPSPNVPGAVGGIFWYQYPASGNPSDPWTKHTIISDPSGQAYEAMAAVDVDHDGHVDIIASLDGSIYWFKNPGTLTGTWQQQFVGWGHGENTISVGDFDGDGKLDIATNSYIYFQNSPTSWTTVAINRGSYIASAALDIGSGKGRIDLVGNSATAPSPSSAFNIIWLENPREHGGERADRSLAHPYGGTRLFLLGWHPMLRWGGRHSVHWRLQRRRAHGHRRWTGRGEPGSPRRPEVVRGSD